MTALNCKPCVISQTERFATCKARRLLPPIIHPFFKHCSHVSKALLFRSIHSSGCFLTHISGDKHQLNADTSQSARRLNCTRFHHLFLPLSLFSILRLPCLRLRFSLLSLHASSPLQARSIIVITSTATQHQLAPSRYHVCETLKSSGLSGGRL